MTNVNSYTSFSGDPPEIHLKQIRSNERSKDIPVIIFSTAVNPATNYKKLGANEVLTQPSNYKSLVNLLRDVLEKLLRFR